MRIRNYRADDAPAIAQLFYETVHTVNRRDYSPEQLRVWAPEVPDPGVWHARLLGRRTLVAEREGEVAAFAELERNGHLAMLYCRADLVGRGIGSELYRAVEDEARSLGLGRVFTEASLTARPFFESRGFRLKREQTVVLRGVKLRNFALQKLLGPGVPARRDQGRS